MDKLQPVAMHFLKKKDNLNIVSIVTVIAGSEVFTPLLQACRW